jgi:hypothetical protein
MDQWIMKFKQWLKKIEEVSTSTGDVAIYARPIFSGDWRMYPDVVQMDDPNETRKKDKKNMSKL